MYTSIYTDLYEIFLNITVNFSKGLIKCNIGQFLWPTHISVSFQSSFISNETSLCAVIYNVLFSGFIDANITCQTDQHSRDSMTCKWNKFAWAVIRLVYRYVDSHPFFSHFYDDDYVKLRLLSL